MGGARAWAALAALVGLALGGALGWLLHGDDAAPGSGTDAPVAPVPPPGRDVSTGPAGPSAAEAAMAAATPADTAAQLAALREALAFEQQARIDLTDDVARLREEVASLEARRSRGSEGSLPFGAAAAPAVSEAAGAHGAGAQATPEWFDDDALLARGLSPDEVERLRTRFEAAELDELYLRDLAVREGWDRTPRFRKELNESREALRTELGDEDYDRVLFATGRNNRVLIQDVLRDSPASSAGLRGGDVLVRYDGQLILDPQELRNATTGGRAGETVAVDVMRGEQTLRLYIPRGPMGARLGRTLGAPEE